MQKLEYVNFVFCVYILHIADIFSCQHTVFTMIFGKNIYPSFALKIGTNRIGRGPAEQQ